MRRFEVVSRCKDMNVELPKRKTKKSAGYDFFAVEDFTLYPNKLCIVPTGVKAYMEDNEVLYLHIRSSVAFKRGVRMLNSIGVIDADFVDNSDNEGEISLGLLSHNDDIVHIQKGERIAQGVFHKFLITDDDDAEGKRVGGIGSTDK
jgi:DUTP diphosphatase|nr:MAG TPA: dUTPase [Caudoviricetes sp.]